MIYYKCRIRVELTKTGLLFYYPEFKKHWWSKWVNHHGWLDIKKAELEIKAKLKVINKKNKNYGNNSIG